MKPELNERTYEKQIASILINLGFLSLMAAFPVIYLSNSSFEAIMAAGIICGMFTLLLGSRTDEIR